VGEEVEAIQGADCGVFYSIRHSFLSISQFSGGKVVPNWGKYPVKISAESPPLRFDKC
jgi:hypothetical protein